MRTLMIPSVLLSIFVGTVVGVRLLLLARRTRKFPELAVGSALFGFAFIAQTALVATQVVGAEASFGFHMALVGLCVAGYYVMLVGLSTFTWQVFGAGSRWRQGMALLIVASGLISSSVTFWANWELYGTDGQMPLHGRIGITPQYILLLSWTSIESLRYWGLMRKRQALGLADLETTVRFAVWGMSAGIGSLLLIALFVVSLTREGLFQDDPATAALVSVAGLVNAVGWWLTFMPPLFYTRWLKSRTASHS